MYSSLPSRNVAETSEHLRCTTCYAVLNRRKLLRYVSGGTEIEMVWWRTLRGMDLLRMDDTAGVIHDDMEQAPDEKPFVVTDTKFYIFTCAVLEQFLYEMSRDVWQGFIGFDEHTAKSDEGVAVEGSIVCCVLHVTHGLIQ